MKRRQFHHASRRRQRHGRWRCCAAQQIQRVRRIGVLMGLAADDPESQARLAAFAQGLQQAGWTVGQNIRIDYRWGAGNADTMRKHAAELVAQSPDVILAHSSAAVAPLLQESRTIPIVFTLVADPVGAGYVSSLARPGRQRHGLHQLRIFDRRQVAGAAQGDRAERQARRGSAGILRGLRARDSSARSRPRRIRSAWSCGRSICGMPARSSGTSRHFAQDPDGGLIVTGSPAATVHRELIYALALRHRLPVVFNSRFYVDQRWPDFLRPDFVDQFRRAAAMSIRFSRARALRPCRCRRRPSTNLRSI